MQIQDQFTTSLAVGGFDGNGGPDLVMGDNMDDAATTFSNETVPPVRPWLIRPKVCGS